MKKKFIKNFEDLKELLIDLAKLIKENGIISVYNDEQETTFKVGVLIMIPVPLDYIFSQEKKDYKQIFKDFSNF